MLVLTRKPQQQLRIGQERIVVTVLEVKAGRVRLGIEAPDDVSIRRREVVLRDVDQPEMIARSGF